MAIDIKSLPSRTSKRLFLSKFATVLLIFWLSSYSQAGDKSCDGPPKPCDVRIGTPIVTAFDRAFPLLDGLFQDVAAIQIKPLQLDPTGVNATNFDAVLQQFQLSVQYSLTAGIQNAVAAQQAASSSANIALQNQLISSETQLYGQLQAAVQDAAAKQKASDALAADPNSDPKAAAAALKASTLANDQVTSLNSELTNVKGLITTPPTSISFQAVEPGGSGASGLGATGQTPNIQTPPTNFGVSSNAATPSNFVPSFPAYKQLEAQTSLLRERMAKLVSTLSQQVDPAKYSLYLIEFHAAPMPGRNKRKKDMLSVEYELTGCDGLDKPYVVDLFPRDAAVNISNEKYRDSRFGLSLRLPPDLTQTVKTLLAVR